MTSNKQLLVQGSLLFGGAALGALAGYFYAKTKFDKLYADRADSEIALMKKHFEMETKTGEFSTPESAIETIIASDPEKRASYQDKMQGLKYSDISNLNLQGSPGGPEVVAVVEEEIHVSRTIEVPDTSALFQEHATEPYLITVADFNTDEPNYHDKLSYEYYPDGNVLVDATEEMVEGWQDIVGIMFAEHFGNQSDDPEIVYVRNPKLGADFEITRNDTNYQTHVAGIGDGD